jgi:hypothetical protein
MTNKFFTIKERILYLLEYKKITKSTFFEKIGMTYGGFTGKNKKKPIKSDSLANILAEIPDLNALWLLTGKGEMLNESKEKMLTAADQQEKYQIKSREDYWKDKYIEVLEENRELHKKNVGNTAETA